MAFGEADSGDCPGGWACSGVCGRCIMVGLAAGFVMAGMAFLAAGFIAGGVIFGVCLKTIGAVLCFACAATHGGQGGQITCAIGFAAKDFAGILGVVAGWVEIALSKGRGIFSP